MQAKAITVRIDEPTKVLAERLLDEIGLNMTTYINSCLKALVRERKVPFQLAADPLYTTENIERILASVKQLDDGRGVVRELIEV